MVPESVFCALDSMVPLLAVGFVEGVALHTFRKRVKLI